MNDQSQLLSRVEEALGPAAATMIAKPGPDRHLIVEAALTFVSLFLIAKYLDGFIDGLGLTDLVEKQGNAAKNAAQFCLNAITGKKKLDTKDLEGHAEAMTGTVDALRDHKSDPEALARASAKLVELLQESGIPKTEAERLSEEIVKAIWLP